MPVPRRRLAWALLAAGVALLGLFAALPRIHGFEHTCDADFSAPRLAGDGWWAIRGPQIGGESSPVYDAANRTTLVVPGCGHEDAGIAVRVRGDHRGFTREDDHLILEGHGVTGDTTLLVTRARDGSNRTLHVLDGTFEAHSRVPHALVLGGGLAAAAAGLGLLRTSHPNVARTLPLGAAAGTLLGHGALGMDAGLMLFLMIAPAMMLGALGALIGTGLAWKRPSWPVRAALLAFAIAWWVTFVAFLGSYPLSPDA